MARFNIFTVVTSLFLLGDVVIAQYYPRNTGLNGTTPKATPTSSKSGSVISSFSSIDGPFIQAYSSTWTQVIIPTTVGTVMITVNEATNQTFSTTVYHTDYERNGSATLLTRTDVDAAGTVTQVVTKHNQTVTVTYPTNYFEVAESLTWDAILPTVVSDKTCCFDQPTLSAAPTHTPFVQTGNLDTKDPRGWLYKLVGFDDGDEDTILGATAVSSLWSGQTLSIDYEGCSYAKCSLGATSVSPASAVQAQPGAILATSRTTISSLPAGGSTTAKPANSPSSTPQSTQVSGAPPQSSAAPSPQTQPPKASSTSPQAGSQNPNPVSVPAQSQSGSAATPNPASPPVQTPGSSAAAPNPASPPAQTQGNSPATANPVQPSNFVTAGQTILPGSSITLGSGPSATVVAVQTSGSNTVVVIGGSISSTLTPAAAPTPAVTPAPAITIGSSIITANSASQYIIAGQTLVPGSSVTLGSGSSTTVVALQTSGSNSVLVVGASSSTLNKAAAATPPPITVGSSVITADSASHYVIAGQTLVPGGPGIVVGGTTISLSPGGTQLIEGTQTIAQSTGIGGIIWSIIGGGPTGTATGNTAGTTGSTALQASGVGALRSFWAAVMIPAVLCCAAMI